MSTFLPLVLLIVGVILILYSGVMHYRNKQVSKYRLGLIDQIDKVNLEEINRGELGHWRQRWERFNEVTYDEMMAKFWKPLDSFYKDTSFLK